MTDATGLRFAVAPAEGGKKQLVASLSGKFESNEEIGHHLFAEGERMMKIGQAIVKDAELARNGVLEVG